MTLLERIIEYKNKEPDPIIEEYQQYIVDTSIPLNDRWDVFSAAPDEWKNQDSFIPHFSFEKKIPNFSWYDVFYKERYQTIYLSDIIEGLESNLDWHMKKFSWTQDLVDEWKEEVLAMNLGSFIYDW